MDRRKFLKVSSSVALGAVALSSDAFIAQPGKAAAPAAQRKTIRVKRPTQRRTVKSVSVKRASGGEEGAAAVAGGPAVRSVAPIAATDSAHDAPPTGHLFTGAPSLTTASA